MRSAIRDIASAGLWLHLLLVSKSHWSMPRRDGMTSISGPLGFLVRPGVFCTPVCEIFPGSMVVSSSYFNFNLIS